VSKILDHCYSVTYRVTPVKSYFQSYFQSTAGDRLTALSEADLKRAGKFLARLFDTVELCPWATQDCGKVHPGERVFGEEARGLPPAAERAGPHSGPA